MKKLRKFFNIVCATILAVQTALAAQLFLLPLPAAKADDVGASDNTPEVVINEIMWMGSYVGGTNSSADEWIELFNTTDEPINLTNWRLTGSGLPIFPSDKTIPAKAYFLVSNYDRTNADSILDVEPDWVSTAISLNNTCQPITLEKPDPDNLGEYLLVDQVGCNGSNYFAGLNDTANQKRASMERRINAEGRGDTADKWQTSILQTNIKAEATFNNRASPKALNEDPTPPLLSTVRDGDQLAEDHELWNDETTLSVNWDDFVDNESGIAYYKVAYYNEGDPTCEEYGDLSWSDPDDSLNKVHTFRNLDLENGLYFTCVKAVNGAGKSTIGKSNGIVLFTDESWVEHFHLDNIPNSQGRQIKASWSISDTVENKLNSFTLAVIRDDLEWEYTDEQIGADKREVIVEGTMPGYEYIGLLSACDSYGNCLPEVFSDSLEAKDEIAPAVLSEKLTVEMNKPGSNDFVYGLSKAVAEPNEAYVEIYDKDPSDQTAKRIDSSGIKVREDGSFDRVSIGDNRYNAVYLLARDNSGNSSVAYKLLNDIVGPSAALLEKVTTDCVGETHCRVNLQWINNDPDAVSFQVGYRTDGSETRTMEVGSKSLALDLPINLTYEFAVYSFDAAGNPSERSNLITVRLTKGVKTTVIWQDGRQITQTEAIAGSLETLEAEPMLPESIIAPPAQAAEPISLASPTPTEGKTADSGDRDWVRIFVVVVILLIIAGSFYALSRSIKENEPPSDEQLKLPEEQPPAKQEITEKPKQKPKNFQNKSKRRRR